MPAGCPLTFLDAAAVTAALSHADAAAALDAALRAGLDPEADPPRASVPVGGGELLVMPSAPGGGAAAVKLVTVGGDPRIQGVCVVFDPHTLAPAAVLDGSALTTLRTAAVSALAVRRLAAPGARRLLVFGRGPQGRAHAEAIPAVVPTIDQVDVVGRDHDDVDVGAYDVIACCTTARTPLFDGACVAPEATVVAIGSHEPGARELDAALLGRASVVVESRASALREAGDVIAAIAEGALEPGALSTLAEDRAPAPGRPRVFKSTGMAWEDAVVAAAVVRAGWR
jgi:ornithine cyclodeaminase/alanine dehydrogenase-like protein (mu-crystallin family)